LVLGWRVLVVEDDYLIAMDMVSMLHTLGAVPVGPAGRLADALALLEAEGGRLDFATLDLDLGGRPTYPVADALAARGIRFTFVTGFRAEALDPAYRSYPRLEKPIDKRMLNAALINTG
jgi:CheY-like chemotaxis protein